MSDVFEKFHTYDFENFSEYQNGLKLVFQQYLEHMAQSEDYKIKQVQNVNEPLSEGSIDPKAKEQLIAQAKVYFFCEKTGEILNLEDYEAWKKTNMQGSSYQKIVELIVSGQPVPGIKEIPDVVLGKEEASAHELKERKKPWEE